MSIRDLFKSRTLPVDQAGPLATARQVVSEYFHLVDPADMDIHDELELPYKKDVILKSVQLVYEAEEAPERREALLVGAARLAYFQPNIGRTPLYAMGVPAEKLNSLAAMDPQEGARLLAAHTEDRARFDRAYPEVQTEAGRMVAVVRGERSPPLGELRRVRTA